MQETDPSRRDDVHVIFQQEQVGISAAFDFQRVRFPYICSSYLIYHFVG